MYNMNTCKEKFEHFQSTVENLLDEHMPKQVVTKVHRHKPWVTRQFEDLVRKRQWAHRFNKQKFDYYRSRVKNGARFLRREFYKSRVAHLKESDPHKWWKHTKQLLGESSNSDDPLQAMAVERHNGDNKQLADEINLFYQSDTKDLPPLDVTKLPQRVDHVPEQYIIPVENVEQKLMKVNIRKAVSPDQVPNMTFVV